MGKITSISLLKFKSKSFRYKNSLLCWCFQAYVIKINKLNSNINKNSTADAEMDTRVVEQGVHTSVTVVIFLQWLFTEAHQYA